MRYRRNIDTPYDDPMRRLRSASDERLFYQLYYGSSLNFNFIRLLACLDFDPALEILEGREPKDQIRFGVQFPKIDFNELDEFVPHFSRFFIIRAIRETYQLIGDEIGESGAPVDMWAHHHMARIGMYLEEFEFYPEACYTVIHDMSASIGDLEASGGFIGMLSSLFGPPSAPPSRQGPNLIRFLLLVLDYLNKICGKCPRCDIYHGSEDVDFSRPIVEFRRNVVFEAFQLARKFEMGVKLKHKLIDYVFDALEKRSIHARLQHAPVAERVKQRLEDERLGRG